MGREIMGAAPRAETWAGGSGGRPPGAEGQRRQEAAQDTFLGLRLPQAGGRGHCAPTGFTCRLGFQGSASSLLMARELCHVQYQTR